MGHQRSSPCQGMCCALSAKGEACDSFPLAAAKWWWWLWWTIYLETIRVL
jgi:hypothetical protein